MYYVSYKYGEKSQKVYRDIKSAGVVPVLDTSDMTTELVDAKSLIYVASEVINLTHIRNSIYTYDSVLEFCESNISVSDNCLKVVKDGLTVSFHERANASFGILVHLKYFFRFRDYLVMRFMYKDSDDIIHWISEAYDMSGTLKVWWSQDMRYCTNTHLATMIDTLSGV